MRRQALLTFCRSLANSNNEGFLHATFSIVVMTSPFRLRNRRGTISITQQERRGHAFTGYLSGEYHHSSARVDADRDFTQVIFTSHNANVLLWKILRYRRIKFHHFCLSKTAKVLSSHAFPINKLDPARANVQLHPLKYFLLFFASKLKSPALYSTFTCFLVIPQRKIHFDTIRFLDIFHYQLGRCT